MKKAVSNKEISFGLLWVSLVCLFIYYYSFYFGINVPLLTIIGKLPFYIGLIASVLIMSFTRLSVGNKTVSGFIIFQVWTIFTTVISNYTLDGPMWKQLIYMLSFCSCLVVSYKFTQEYGYANSAEKSKKYVVFFLIVFVVLARTDISRTLRTHANMIYYVVLCLPFVSQVRRKTMQILLYVGVGILTLFSMKRTAFLAYILFLLVLYIYQNITEKKPNSSKMILTGILIAVAFVVGYNFILDRFGTNLLATLSISALREDQGSNRLYIYDMVLKAQQSSNIGHWLIGAGYNGVFANQIANDGFGGVYVSAHNDLLEILYDYGIPGLIMYAVFIVRLCKETIYSIKIKAEYAPPFVASLLIFFVFSTTSHVIIYYTYFCLLLVFWGSCFAENSRKKIRYKGTKHD